MSWHSTLISFSLKRQKSIFSASLVLAITFGLSAILGFLRSRFLYAQFFGCCVQQLDAYNAAFRLPDLIFKLLVTGALSASFIPVFSSYLHRHQKSAHQLASTVINLLLIVFIFVAVFVFIFTRPLSEIIATGFSPAQIDLMVELTRILLLAQIFFLISNFLTAILQVNQIFIVPAISPIVYNFFIILSIFTLAPSFGIHGVVYGAVVGAFFHLAIQIPIARKVGYRYSFFCQPRLSGVREIVRLMIPRSLSLGLGEIENTVTLFFASTLTSGSISILSLALQIIYLPSRIFGTTVGQASLPILSRNVAKNRLNTFRTIVNKTILQSLFIALPITVLILTHRLAIIRIAFGAKQFPWSATLLTARTLAWLTPAIVCQAVIQILIRSFYALHNTKTPLYVSFFSLIANLLASYFFVNFTSLGVVGLAISATIGSLVQFFGLIIFFIAQVDGFSWHKTLGEFLKLSFCSLILGTVTWTSLRGLDLFLLDTTRTVNLIILFSISSLSGLIAYLASIYYLAPGYLTPYRNYLVKIGRLFKPHHQPTTV